MWTIVVFCVPAQPDCFLCTHVVPPYTHTHSYARHNTRRGIETCGILAGTLSANDSIFTISTLIIPKQVCVRVVCVCGCLCVWLSMCVVICVCGYLCVVIYVWLSMCVLPLLFVLSHTFVCAVSHVCVYPNKCIPPHTLSHIRTQEGTSDTVQALGEEEIFDVQDTRGLYPLGWIHTHPTQTCFLSSIDVHTHCGYQVWMLRCGVVVYDAVDIIACQHLPTSLPTFLLSPRFPQHPSPNTPTTKTPTTKTPTTPLSKHTHHTTPPHRQCLKSRWLLSWHHKTPPNDVACFG